MATNTSKGKQLVVDISTETKQKLKDSNLFPVSLFQSNPFAEVKFSYADFETATLYIVTTIRSFFKLRSDESEIQWLLQPAFDSESELIEWIESINPTSTILNSRTLYRSIDKGYLSISNLAILNCFFKIREIQQKETEILSLYHGLYLEIGIHTTTNAFQLSLLHIKTSSYAELKYTSIRRNKEVIDKLNVSLTDKGRAITLFNRSAKYSHFFHLHLGGDAQEDETPFLQGIQTYANANNSASSVSVFYRLSDINDKQEFFNNFKPKRKIKSLLLLDEFKELLSPLHSKKLDGYFNITALENIQYFLVNRGSTYTVDNKPYERHDFRRSLAVEPGFSRTQALHYVNDLSFVGEYELYYQERFPTQSKRAKSQKLGAKSIGLARLIIEQNKITGIIETRLYVLSPLEGDSTKNLEFKGHLINHKLNDTGYLFLNLYLKPTGSRLVSFIFKADNEKNLSGSFNITYLAKGQLGAGVCFAKKISSDAAPIQPQSLFKDEWNESHLAKEQFDFLFSHNSIAFEE